VQAAGHLVAAASELPARVEDRVHDLQGIFPGGMPAHRDAAPVVLDGDGAIGGDRHVDPGGVAGHRLVDRVVHHFPDEVMEASHVGGPDIHAGPATNGLEALEDLDAGGGVLAAARRALRPTAGPARRARACTRRPIRHEFPPVSRS
jgi:hypothetical protein